MQCCQDPHSLLWWALDTQVLNAKPENVERESEIVAQSGRKGAVTISTNMAGRGAWMLALTCCARETCTWCGSKRDQRWPCRSSVTKGGPVGQV